MKKESRRCFLEAQQAVAEIAVEQLVEMLPEDFFEKTERLLNGLNGVESVILVTLPPPSMIQSWPIKVYGLGFPF